MNEQFEMSFFAGLMTLRALAREVSRDGSVVVSAGMELLKKQACDETIAAAVRAVNRDGDAMLEFKMALLKLSRAHMRERGYVDIQPRPLITRPDHATWQVLLDALRDAK